MSKIQLITVVTRTTEDDYMNHPLFSFSIKTDETNIYILRHLSEWLDQTMNQNVFNVPKKLKELYDENCYDPMLNPFYQGLAKNGTLKGFPYLIKGDPYTESDNPNEKITPVLAVIPAMAGDTRDRFGEHNFKVHGAFLIPRIKEDVKRICKFKDDDQFYRNILIVHDYEWDGVQKPNHYSRCMRCQGLFDYVCIFKHDNPNTIFNILKNAKKIEDIDKNLKETYPNVF